MAVYKCKMCGGSLNILGDSTVCECEYCGSVQTVPALDDEKKANLFSRANSLRSRGEFDQAINVYGNILLDFPEEAEAYWGQLLCKFGIEYVDDPLTGRKVPTCHRASFDCFMEDPDFDMVMAYADPEATPVYRNQAKEIEQIRTGIIEVSEKEEPYDVFICYKETDDFGDRTEDSVKAQDIYDQLTRAGYRVFFSRISLEDKLGQEYEPYIFAALNSADVMLVFGTKYEYFNAVWVKNEWSRFLSMKEKGRKKTLIPCYEYIDAYDMPKEFKLLQAQDMGKIGWDQDLIRGIKKICYPRGVAPGQANAGGIQMTAESQMSRAEIFMHDKQWDRANECFETILDADPNNAEAYLGETLCNYECMSLDELENKLISEANNTDFSEENVESLFTDQVRNTLQSYEVPGYLFPEDIEKVVREKGNYAVPSASSRETWDRIESICTKEISLNHAFQFAQGELADQLAAFRTNITNAVEEAKAKAEDMAEHNRTEAWNSMMTQENELRKQAEMQREEDYQQTARIPAQDADIPADMETYERIGDYKDTLQWKNRISPVYEKMREIGSGHIYLGKRLVEEEPDKLKEYKKNMGLYEGHYADFDVPIFFWFIYIAVFIVIYALYAYARNSMGGHTYYGYITYGIIGTLAFSIAYAVIRPVLAGILGGIFWIVLLGVNLPIRMHSTAGTVVVSLLFLLAMLVYLSAYLAYFNFFIPQIRTNRALKRANALLGEFRNFEQKERKSLSELWNNVLGREMQIKFDGVSELFDTNRAGGIKSQEFSDLLHKSGLS